MIVKGKRSCFQKVVAAVVVGYYGIPGDPC